MNFDEKWFTISLVTTMNNAVKMLQKGEFDMSKPLVVFCPRIAMVNRFHQQLLAFADPSNESSSIFKLHGNMQDYDRKLAIEGFKGTRGQVIVCTFVGAYETQHKPDPIHTVSRRSLF